MSYKTRAIEHIGELIVDIKEGILGNVCASKHQYERKFIQVRSLFLFYVMLGGILSGYHEVILFLERLGLKIVGARS